MKLFTIIVFIFMSNLAYANMQGMAGLFGRLKEALFHLKQTKAKQFLHHV